MAQLSISSLLSFFKDEENSIDKGENHYRSNHVESFAYIPGVLRGQVHASTKNKVYNVTVSEGQNENGGQASKKYFADQSKFQKLRLLTSL